ncbi:MAG: 23S rRNA (uracil(1939)-C(5))-methyltransferase RlmD [Candidatus Baltobacteraceae bacterium]
MRVGQVLEVAFGDVLATGQGVGRALGMALFAWGPLPGERARVRVELVKANYAVGEVVEYLERSPERVEPFCGVFGRCGGCQVQHLAYDAQLRWKRSIVENALRRIGRIPDARVLSTIGMSEPRAYRNKMALVTETTPEGTAFGFYAARSHAIVPIERCPIVRPELDALIGALWAAGREAPTKAAFEGAQHLVARVGTATGESVVAVSTVNPSAGLNETGAALLERLPGAIGIGNSFDPASANAVMGRRQKSVAGETQTEERIDDVQFRVSTASFFQVNSAMVGQIFAYLRPVLRRGMRVVDLYCGAGTFSLFFAREGARVLGIEENPAAVREAQANAVRNGSAAEVAFLTGRVERVLGAGHGAAFLKHADVVFLDPPRKGSDEATLGAVAAAGTPHVWYLSCNPATLARDLAFLLTVGYRLGSVQPFDMFPQTGHVESLAVLTAPRVPALDWGV